MLGALGSLWNALKSIPIMMAWAERIRCMRNYDFMSGRKRSTPFIVRIREPEMTCEAEYEGFLGSRFMAKLTKKEGKKTPM